MRGRQQRLEVLKARAAAQIRNNLLAENEWRETIVRLMWWNLLLLERWKKGEADDDVRLEIMTEVNRLEKAGFFSRDQRKPINEWAVFEMMKQEIRSQILTSVQGLR